MNRTRGRRNHQAEKVARSKRHHTAAKVAMTSSRRRLPSRTCTLSKCATLASRACWRCLYSPDGDDELEPGTEVLSPTRPSAKALQFPLTAAPRCTGTRLFPVDQKYSSKTCPIFRPEKAAINAPRLPRISPQLHHKSTTFCTRFSPKPPCKNEVSPAQGKSVEKLPSDTSV